MTEQVPLTVRREKPGLFYGYIVVVAAFFIFMVLDGTMYSFGVFFKPLSAEFGWSRAMTSGAFALFQFVLGLAFLVTGRLTDRFGPRLVMIVCGTLLGLAYILMSRVNVLWQLYLFYGVIAALGMGGGLVPLPSTVARWFIRRRGIMTGITVSGIGVGIIIGPPLSTQLIANLGWREAYLITGGAALVLLVLLAQLLRRDPAQVGQLPYGADEAHLNGGGPKLPAFSLAEAVHTPQFWMLSVMYFCASYSLQAIMTHMVPHTTDLGIPSMVAATIVAVIGGVSIVGRVGMGGTSDRIGCRKSLVISFFLLSVSFAWLLISREVWAFYVFATVFGLAYGAKVSMMSPAVAEVFGLKSHGEILGAIVFINQLGGAAGPLVTGWVFDISNSYFVAFLICTMLSIFGLTLTLLLRPIRQEAQ